MLFAHYSLVCMQWVWAEDHSGTDSDELKAYADPLQIYIRL